MISPQRNDRDRCWLSHKRKENWILCPLCGKPIKWVRLWPGGYSPCDTVPVMYSKSDRKTKYQIVVKGDFICNVLIRAKPTEKPRYGYLPHYYTCPVLVRERREWAIANCH